jgi:hypothetical protein
MSEMALYSLDFTAQSTSYPDADACLYSLNYTAFPAVNSFFTDYSGSPPYLSNPGYLTGFKTRTAHLP